jgi:uncharacterized membrane protein
MDKVWSVFWKFFLIVIVAAVIVSIILGIERQSSALAADLLQKTMVIAMGICGVIGIAVVPVELYFTDRANRVKNGRFGSGLDSGNENASI